MWKPSHMENWQKWFDRGHKVHDAYDKIPIAGGKRIAQIKLTERPYWETLSNMPTGDLKKEGGMVTSKEAFYELIDLPPSARVAVIRFRVLGGYGAGGSSAA